MMTGAQIGKLHDLIYDRYDSVSGGYIFVKDEWLRYLDGLGLVHSKSTLPIFDSIYRGWCLGKERGGYIYILDPCVEDLIKIPIEVGFRMLVLGI